MCVGCRVFCGGRAAMHRERFSYSACSVSVFGSRLYTLYVYTQCKICEGFGDILSVWRKGFDQDVHCDTPHVLRSSQRHAQRRGWDLRNSLNSPVVPICDSVQNAGAIGSASGFPTSKHAANDAARGL